MVIYFPPTFPEKMTPQVSRLRRDLLIYHTKSNYSQIFLLYFICRALVPDPVPSLSTPPVCPSSFHRGQIFHTKRLSIEASYPSMAGLWERGERGRIPHQEARRQAASGGLQMADTNSPVDF